MLSWLEELLQVRHQPRMAVVLMQYGRHFAIDNNTSIPIDGNPLRLDTAESADQTIGRGTNQFDGLVDAEDFVVDALVPVRQ
jgi:hypothetical protein